MTRDGQPSVGSFSCEMLPEIAGHSFGLLIFNELWWPTPRPQWLGKLKKAHRCLSVPELWRDEDVGSSQTIEEEEEAIDDTLKCR